MSNQVSFRLSADWIEELENLAKQKGMSRHELAKEFVVSQLANDPLHETRNRVAEIEEDLQQFREDHRVAVLALLAAAGKVSTEEAEEWVRENLPR